MQRLQTPMAITVTSIQQNYFSDQNNSHRKYEFHESYRKASGDQQFLNQEVGGIQYQDQQSPLSFRASFRGSQRKLSHQQLHNYTLIYFSDILNLYKLSETNYSPKKSKCSCFGSDGKGLIVQEVKKRFIQFGGDHFDLKQENHRNTLYTVLMTLNETVNEQQIQDFAEKVEIFYQVLSFLSCLEQEKSYFKLLKENQGQQLIEIVLAVCKFAFEQLNTHKLDNMINKNPQYALYNLLRNYEVGILQHLTSDLQKQDQNIEQILQFYKKNYQPTYFLNHYQENRQLNRFL